MADGKISLGSREKISKSVGPGGKFVLTVWFTYISKLLVQLMVKGVNGWG